MREEEKIFAGQVFWPGHPDVVAIKLRCHNLCTEYNRTFEDEKEKRAEIVQQIFGVFGEGSFVQGPLQIHYGVHTKLFRQFQPDDSGRCAGHDRRPLQFWPECHDCHTAAPAFAGRAPCAEDERRPGDPCLLCTAGYNRQRLLVWCKCRRVSRCHDRRQLRDRCRQCGHKGYSGEQHCGRQSVPRAAHAQRCRQHEAPPGAVRQRGICL